MTKKLIMFITATVIAATMLLLPVSAARPDNLTNAMVSSVDYRTESPADLTGNLSFVQDAEDIEYVEFDGITCVDRTCIFNANEGFRRCV